MHYKMKMIKNKSIKGAVALKLLYTIINLNKKETQ